MDLKGILSGVSALQGGIGSMGGMASGLGGNALTGLADGASKILTNMKQYPEWAKSHPIMNSLLQVGAGGLGGLLTSKLTGEDAGTGFLAGAAGGVGYPAYQDWQKKQEVARKAEDDEKWKKLMLMMQSQGGIYQPQQNTVAGGSSLPQQSVINPRMLQEQYGGLLPEKMY